jgi:hypothetical protein
MAKQPIQRGGAREGAGRKPKPPEERRHRIFAIKVTDAEKELLDATEAGKWARDVLIRSAKKRQ